MPLVFVTGAPTASGHSYNDVLGEFYEFPTRYRGAVQTGEVFVYYRGVRETSGAGAGYFGAGVVGRVFAATEPARLVAELHDVRFFSSVVGLKDPRGAYLETGETKGTNWPNGVRRLSEDAMRRILASAESLSPSPRLSSGIAGRAEPALASALERFSVGVALARLRTRFDGAVITEMPPGNPGYDILVRERTRELHIEVKGTVLPDPVFHLSEGQRRHAELKADRFQLYVVYDVNLTSKHHRLAIVGGPLLPAKVDLDASKWRGRVVNRDVE